MCVYFDENCDVFTLLSIGKLAVVQISITPESHSVGFRRSRNPTDYPRGFWKKLVHSLGFRVSDFQS